MKKAISMLLVLLMLGASVASCGNGGSGETEGETNTAETTAPVTSADGTYDTSLVTENGIAKAHIVIPTEAEDYVSLGAEELRYHIEKVSGASVSVGNAVEEGSLPIIIAIPDSMPELEELFPEDLAWLRTLSEKCDDRADKRWADDGFAVRSHEGKVYIFGANAKGALNGVYDFIEENLGVLWIRANEDIGLVYDEMPTITVAKTDYREKSPFEIRGWHPAGNRDRSNTATQTMYARNKMSTSSVGGAEMGLIRYGVAHNVKDLVKTSPIYDPNETEYWCTNINGDHLNYKVSPQINFFSDKTVEAVAAAIIANYRDSDETYAFIGMEDIVGWGDVYPEQTEPFEYAPGQFIETGDLKYQSTVFFTFVNKVARIVKEELPELIIATFAYAFSTRPPVCEIDDNVCITFCTYNENLSTLTEEPWGAEPIQDYQMLEGWADITPNLMFYTYYGDMIPSAIYALPVWDRFQSGAVYCAENGFRGIQAEGQADDGSNYGWLGATGNSWSPDGTSPYTNSDMWEMNAMVYWLYAKFLWNPYEDMEALMDYYCDKVYGDASEYMQEYYRLLYIGWKDGAAIMSTEFNNVVQFATPPMTYWDYFINVTVDGVDILGGIQEALENAWNAANDVQKERIRHMREIFSDPEAHFMR